VPVYQTAPQQVFARKGVLACQWLPIVFGFTVYESFESEQVASSGIVPSWVRPKGVSRPAQPKCAVATDGPLGTATDTVRSSLAGTGREPPQTP
jgi:hypothetical protein